MDPDGGAKISVAVYQNISICVKPQGLPTQMHPLQSEVRGSDGDIDILRGQGREGVGG